GMGAVAWGLWPTPRFPFPAHQTGRADFRHPAFRLASPPGTRRDRSGQALEAQNAEFSMNDIECESAIAVPLHLVPSHEEPAHTFEVGTRRSPILVLSRCTLFLDGLAPIYQFP